MKLKVYVIDLEVTSRTKRRIFGASVAGFVLIAGGGALVWAGPIKDSWIESGAEISASSLKANLDDLQGQINLLNAHPTRTVNGEQVSGLATVVTPTAPQNGRWTATGGLLGYAAGKRLCEDANSSPSAHVCSYEELVRSLQVGIEVTPTGSSAWIAAGAYWNDTRTNSGANTLLVGKDCTGFSSAANNDGSGTYFSGPVILNDSTVGPEPGIGYCDASIPILCCD